MPLISKNKSAKSQESTPKSTSDITSSKLTNKEVKKIEDKKQLVNNSCATVQLIKNKKKADSVSQVSISSDQTFSEDALTASEVDFMNDEIERSKALKSVEQLRKEDLTPESWDMVESTWHSQGSDVHEQFKNDAIIWFNTMFPKHKDLFKDKTPKAKSTPISKMKDSAGKVARKGEDNQKGIETTKKLFLALALSESQVFSKGEVTKFQQDLTQGKENKIPLAARLSHGQRESFLFKPNEQNKNVSNEFMDFMFEDRLIARYGASHESKVDKKTGEITEKKLKSKRAQLDLLGQKHQTAPFGALGGLGSVAPDGKNHMGPGGIIYDEDGNQVKSTVKKEKDGKVKDKTATAQQGHMYVNNQNVDSKGFANVMLGVEGNAPTTNSAFGKSHDLDSGLEDQTQNTSVTGGDKMQKLLSDAPAEEGGKQSQITEEIFKEIKEAWDVLCGVSEKEQEELFKKMLVLPQKEAKTELKNFVQQHKKD